MKNRSGGIKIFLKLILMLCGAAAAVAGVLLLCFSPFVLRVFWIPHMAEKAGASASVEYAEIRFSWPHPLFCVRGLHVTNPTGNELRIGTGEYRFSPVGLALGTPEIGNITLRDVSISVRRIPDWTSPQGQKERPRIGSCRIENMSLSFDPEISPHLSSFFIDDLTLTGFHAATENILKSNCHLRFSSGAELPLKAEVTLIPGQDEVFLPDLTGSVQIMPGKGIFAERSMETMIGKVYFDIRRRKNSPTFRWHAKGEIAGIDFAEYLKISGNGEFSESCDRGTAELRLSTLLNRPELCRLCPPLAGFAEMMMPEEMSVPDWQVRLRKEGEILAWTTQGKVEWPHLRVNGKTVLGKGQSEVRQNGSYDFRTKIFSFHDMRLELRSGDTSFLCETPEKNTVTLSPDGMFRWKTRRAPVVIHAKNIPALLLDPFLPVNFSSGTFSLDYDGTVDTEKKRIDGVFDMKLASAAIDFEGRRFLDSHDLSVRMNLHSDGLDDIETFAVDSCQVAASSDGKTFLSGDLSGSFRFDDGALSLGGNLETIPYDLLGLIRDPLADLLREKMSGMHAEHTKNSSFVRLGFDPRKSKHMTWSLATGLDNLSMLGRGFAEKPLQLSLSGSASRENAESGEIRIAGASLSAPGLLDVRGTGKISFPSGKLDFSLQLNDFAPDLWKGGAAFLLPGVFTEADLAPFNYGSLRGGGAFTLNPSDRSIRVRSFQLELVPMSSSDTEKPSAKLTLERDYLFSYEDPSKGECRMMLVFRKFPVTWFNMFIPRDVPYKFLSGTGHAAMEVTAKNLFRHIFLNVDVTGEEYAFSACDGKWSVDDVHIDGVIGFTDYFRSFLFRNLHVICAQANEHVLEGVTDGNIGLWDRMPTALHFRIDRTGALFPVILFGGFMEELPAQTFECTGLFTYEAEDKFENSDFHGKANIAKWVFSDAPEGLALHGEAPVRIEFRPGSVRFRKSGLNLTAPDGRKIFNCFLESDFRDAPAQADARCRLTSDGMDLAFFLRTLFFRNRADYPPVPADAGTSVFHRNSAADPVMRERNAPWPFRSEPPPLLRLCDVPTSLSVDFRNIRCTDFLTMNLSGACHVDEGRIRADDVRLGINDAQAHLSFKADLSPADGCEYEGEMHGENLSATDLILAASELKYHHFPGDQLQGMIRKLDLKLKGKGISLKKLDENLEMSGAFAVESLSVPFDARGSSVLLKILLLPLEHLPRLIGFIPQKQIRNFLQDLMGKDMEILTGQRNIDFDTGFVEVVSDHTDLHIKKMYFLGPRMRFRVERGFFNPFYNELNVDSFSRFSSVNYPLRFIGTIDNPAIDIPRFLAAFLNRNTFRTLNETVHLVTFGLAGDAEADWGREAEIRMRNEK